MEQNEKIARMILSSARVAKRRSLAADLLKGTVTAMELIRSPGECDKYGVDGLDPAKSSTDKDLKWLEMFGGDYIVLGDPRYPRRLLRMGTPPFCLRWQGMLPMGGCLAVVGSRAATRRTMANASNFAAVVSDRGYHVISGGAYGIDAAAHRGSLSVNSGTTAFLGSGLGTPYPQRHIPLFGEIIAAGGGVVSLHHHEFLPFPGAFIERNRVMAALADAVIVVAANLKSGALHTAKAAIQMGTPLFFFPGTPGCDSLASARGTALCEPDAIIDELAKIGHP
ncbi:DNA-protecting protein DprA [Myxococcota bacterium]|nr:DNA-protecting protein DprA [Myxococcota bacterium]